MKELRAIFALLVLVVGSFVLYKVLPVYWGNYKLGRLLEEQAVVYTYTTKSDQDIASAIAEKAADFNVALSPEQVKVQRGGADLGITAEYSVHVELPVYPLDLKFTTSTHNDNVMKK
jgi:hypothetical protein